ncbi:MAG: NHL repeat-containing protein [Anaerolineales bacterium]|nr:NHL repeat-containing protein [Anaerolineales bacterium]
MDWTRLNIRRETVVKLVGIITLLALTVLTAYAQGSWTNGQNALYVIGQPNFTSNGSNASATEIGYPMGVAIDVAHGKLYLSDSFNRVLRFAYPITGNQPTAEIVFGQPNFSGTGSGTTVNTFNWPRGLAVDSSGRLWVADMQNNRVVWFNNAHLIAANQPNADGVLGQLDFISNGTNLTQNGMGNPQGVAVDATGTLWVADYGAQRVLRFDNAAGKANGANADGVLGQADFTSIDPTTLTQNRMSLPIAVAVEGNRLWVADYGNTRVLRFDNAAAKADGAIADGVLGQVNFTTEVGATSQSGMKLPVGVQVDSYGRLYVADGYDSHRVLIFNAAASLANGAAASNVLGKPNFTATGWSAVTQNLFNLDTVHAGLAVDSSADILVNIDTLNNRALVFQASAATPSSAPAVGGVSISLADEPAGRLPPVGWLAAAGILLVLAAAGILLVLAAAWVLRRRSI